MTRFVVALTLVLMMVVGAGRFGAATDVPPSWAYPVYSSSGAPVLDDGRARRVPGSATAFTLLQIRDGFNVPDWHPGDHPPMPAVVAHGRKPAVRGCGYCHLPNGFGRPENSSLAGLPAAYIAEQMADYRKGVRKSAGPRMGSPAAMVAIAQAVDEAEVQAAGEYFASIKPKKWIRVVEVDTVPRTRVSGGIFVPVDEGGTEPIGRRILEVPEDRGRAELRDPTSGFVAYVPVGSIEKGEVLVTTGGSGKTVRCAVCHGADLKGLGPVPGIAGRSPSYQARQLYDIQHHTRHGLGADLMMATVARLTEADLVSIAAYTASRAP